MEVNQKVTVNGWWDSTVAMPLAGQSNSSFSALLSARRLAAPFPNNKICHSRFVSFAYCSMLLLFTFIFRKLHKLLCILAISIFISLTTIVVETFDWAVAGWQLYSGGLTECGVAWGIGNEPAAKVQYNDGHEKSNGTLAFVCTQARARTEGAGDDSFRQAPITVLIILQKDFSNFGERQQRKHNNIEI